MISVSVHSHAQDSPAVGNQAWAGFSIPSIQARSGQFHLFGQVSPLTSITMSKSGWGAGTGAPVWGEKVTFPVISLSTWCWGYASDPRRTFLTLLHLKDIYLYTVNQFIKQSIDSSSIRNHQNSFGTTFKCTDCISIINACMVTYCTDVSGICL